MATRDDQWIVKTYRSPIGCLAKRFSIKKQHCLTSLAEMKPFWSISKTLKASLSSSSASTSYKTRIRKTPNLSIWYLETSSVFLLSSPSFFYPLCWGTRWTLWSHCHSHRPPWSYPAVLVWLGHVPMNGRHQPVLRLWCNLIYLQDEKRIKISSFLNDLKRQKRKKKKKKLILVIKWISRSLKHVNQTTIKPSPSLSNREKASLCSAVRSMEIFKH